jgi:hypothetical protein
MPTDENRMLAKLINSAFGSKQNTRIVEYLNEDNSLQIPILICPSSPSEDSTIYATVGLSDYSMYQDGHEFPTRLEIISAGNTDIDWLPNVISTAAFYIVQKRWLCCPGAILVNALKGYVFDSDLKHLYFTVPFLWQDELKVVQLRTKKVTWLLAIPITDAEHEYCKKHGDEKFEEMLERNRVNVFDLTRHSVI